MLNKAKVVASVVDHVAFVIDRHSRQVCVMLFDTVAPLVMRLGAR